MPSRKQQNQQFHCARCLGLMSRNSAIVEHEPICLDRVVWGEDVHDYTSGMWTLWPDFDFDLCLRSLYETQIAGDY